MKKCIPCGGDGRPQAIIQYHDGKSAYEIALENGFEGTEAEFLVSLKGEKGDQGIQGEIGLDGKSAYQVWKDTGKTGTESDFLADIRGPKGPKGDTGPQGLTGSKGSDGATIIKITAHIVDVVDI